MLTASLIGTEKFYLKVGGLLYKKGADFGLRPDGLIVKSDAEKIEAERILRENIPSEHSRKRKVINPSLGELVAAMGQIDEFRNVRAQFMTQRLEEGATMKQAEEESREITEENIQKAKELRSERAKRKAKVLDKIKSKLPKSSNPEIRARLIQAYLNEHGTEIIAESEQYTLGEIKAEVDLIGSVKGEKAKSFLANYAEAEMVSEEFERNAEEGIRQVYSGLAEGFNRLMIPGYSAYAEGGTPKEVITSAGSDIALTLVGGKVIKVAWTGTKALYNSAKALGKTLAGGKQVAIERVLSLPATRVADHHIFPQKYRPIFKRLGIDIDEYTISLGEVTHLRGIHGKGNAGMPGRWNGRWKEFFENNPDPTAKDVYQFAGRLMDEYGINKGVLHGYRK